jgi:pimeloyl-ACP methyl ester carboxylesterase
VRNLRRQDLGGRDLAAGCGVAEMSARMALAAGAGVEECWMDVDGGRMRYLHAGGGPGAGPPLILLHGLLGYSFSWRYVMPELAKHASVYAPDMLGAGFSDRAFNVDFSMGAVAQRLVQFVEKLGLPSATFDLLGTSHGGGVAMMAAAACLGESRVKVRKLVLVAPVNPYSAHGKRLAPFFGRPLGAVLFRSTVARMPFLFRYGHRRLYADRNAIPPGTLEGYMAPLAVPGFFEHGLKIVQTWTRDLQEIESILTQVGTLPTLLVWGAEDSAVYASSAGPLARHFQNSRTIIFPRVGHLPYEECPAEFNRVVIEFLKGEESPA